MMTLRILALWHKEIKGDRWCGHLVKTHFLDSISGSRSDGRGLRSKSHLKHLTHVNQWSWAATTPELRSPFQPNAPRFLAVLNFSDSLAGGARVRKCLLNCKHIRSSLRLVSVAAIWEIQPESECIRRTHRLNKNSYFSGGRVREIIKWLSILKFIKV